MTDETRPLRAPLEAGLTVVKLHVLEARIKRGRLWQAHAGRCVICRTGESPRCSDGFRLLLESVK